MPTAEFFRLVRHWHALCLRQLQKAQTSSTSAFISAHQSCLVAQACFLGVIYVYAFGMPEESCSRYPVHQRGSGRASALRLRKEKSKQNKVGVACNAVSVAMPFKSPLGIAFVLGGKRKGLVFPSGKPASYLPSGCSLDGEASQAKNA